MYSSKTLNGLLSLLWSGVNFAARRFSSPVKLTARRVISVGNLQVGGAGKTPLVALIAKEANTRGLSVCILTRGYRGEWEKDGGILFPKDLADPRLCGDEAALLREEVPEAWIAVGRNRVVQYERAKTKIGKEFDLVILDDGFQHFKIARDLDVIALTSKNSFQIVHRDFKSAVHSDALIVWTKGESRPISRPLVHMSYSLTPGNYPIWLLTGVADPEEVKRSVAKAGYEVKRHLIFSDHAAYDSEHAQSILKECILAGCKLALTGKDYVKWKQWIHDPLQIEVLEPQLTFLEGRELWDGKLWGASL